MTLMARIKKETSFRIREIREIRGQNITLKIAQ